MIGRFTGFAVLAKLLLLLATTAVFVGAAPQATISHVSPSIGPNHIPIVLDIHGAELTSDLGVMLRRLGQSPQTIDLVNVQLINPTHMRAVVPARTDAGVYDLVLVDVNGEVAAVQEAAYTAVFADETDDLFATSHDFTISPAGAPQVDQPTSFRLRVRRLGGQTPLTNVNVAFYEGEDLTDPVAEGNPIGEALIPLLLPNETAVVTFTSAPPVAGTFQIHAVIDPLGQIAEASETNNVVSRSLTVRPPVAATNPPPTPGLRINNGNLLSRERTVLLDLNPTGDDPNGTVPRSVFYVEYIFNQSLPGWVPIQQSGWLPIPQAGQDFSWELFGQPGVHFVQAWTADQFGNVSAKPGLAFINLVPASGDLLFNEGHLYRWPLAAGEQLLVRVTPQAGDPDLYVWAPDGTLVESSQLVNGVDEVKFTATQTGMHQIEIDGTTAATYELEIVPLELMQAETAVFQFRPKGRFQPYFAPSSDPSDDADIPPAPVNIYINLPLLKRS